MKATTTPKLTKLLAAFTFAVILASTSTGKADLVIANVRESTLPHDLSPSNFDNSPGNFDNAVGKFENSPGNFDNSPGNYDNSPSNYENTVNGTHSILRKKDGQFFHIGYYVRNKNGVTNFYSIKGKRLFYNPKKGMGLFGGNDGEFCGVLANVNDKLSIALTEVGQKALILGE